MPRKINKGLDQVPVLEPRRSNISLALKTITPVFGGGVKAGIADAEYPVRPASIRGHLRFWWRATAGSRYENPKDLFAAEESLWGSSDVPGQVAVMVTNVKAEPRRGSRWPAGSSYFLWPYRETERNRGELVWLESASFSLEVFGSGLEDGQLKEVQTALKAWLLFGGIGARTRRGLGALKVVSSIRDWLPSSPPDIKALLELPEPLGATARDAYTHPSLSGARAVFGPPIKNNAQADSKKTHLHIEALSAWLALVKFWSSFRKEHSGRRWNDYHTMQKFLANNHQSEVELAKPFFGLPIEYKEYRAHRENTISTSTTIKAEYEYGSRMASPVILKPVAFANGEICPMVLLLSAARPEKVRIGGKSARLMVPEDDPVLEALGVNDPLDAVIEAAKQNGWKEEVEL